MTVVKGEGQFLYDSDGRQFLDGERRRGGTSAAILCNCSADRNLRLGHRPPQTILFTNRLTLGL